MTKIKDMLPDEVVEQIEEVVVTDASIIDSMNIPFKPTADIVLIKPLEKVKVEKTLVVIDEEKTEELRAKARAEGDLMADVTVETKEETKEVDSIQRIGVVLALSDKVTNFKVGDKVVYNDRFSAPFDLMHNDAVYVRQFDILGTWLK